MDPGVREPGPSRFTAVPRLNNPVSVPNAFTNSGNPVQVFLTYDAFHATASVGTVSGSVTNLIFNQWPVTNSAGAITPHYLIFQMSTNLTTPTARWATAATVDWLPRPPPMLTLPVPIQQTNFVGAPGTNDVPLIQNAFNLVSNSTSGDGNPLYRRRDLHHHERLADPDIPLCWSRDQRAGQRQRLQNPRHQSAHRVPRRQQLFQCHREGFSVDYDPLPYTQGVVTHNFFTNTPKELAIEFQVDTDYPAPTNANYMDTNAISIARLWGMVMDPTRPGRGADASYPGLIYTNVVQTNSNGAFKVYLQFADQAKSIPPGAFGT